jgi:hypothetical protein
VLLDPASDWYVVDKVLVRGARLLRWVDNDMRLRSDIDSDCAEYETDAKM